MPRRLMVLGLGPKGVAIMAKWHALKRARRAVPDLIVVEKSGVGAAWKGKDGYTDGTQPLCTMPEYDLGFPYRPDNDGRRDPARWLWKNYSWPAYQLNSSKSAEYADQVVRGTIHNYPSHQEFAAYLTWVAERVLRQSEVEHIEGTVTKFRRSGQQWNVDIRTSNEKLTTRKVDGLVVTGSGSPKRFSGQDINNMRTFDAKNVWIADNWRRLLQYADEKREQPIVVIGSGETAATVVRQLAEERPDALIRIVNRSATLFSRGEGYFEEKFFSEKTFDGAWPSFDHSSRQQIIERVDRGVISPASILALSRIPNLQHRAVDVERIEYTDNGEPTIIGPTLFPKVEGFTTMNTRCLVVCTGFDAWGFLNLATGAEFTAMKLAHDARKTPKTASLVLKAADIFSALAQTSGDLTEAAKKLKTNREELLLRMKALSSVQKKKPEERIETDLSIPLPGNRGWPKLHVPMLAALKRGPGYPNLTCLGNLSDRILKSYRA